MKKKITLIFLISLMILISGCSYKGYSGKNVDLYTVAINSILWNNGHSYGADKVKDPEIEVIETDDYGRTVFTYYEKYYSGGKLSFIALITSQYSSENHVYYYEDYNFVIMKRDLSKSENEFFSEENLENLKASNDWNEEINLEKCVKKTINKVKQNIPYSVVIKEKVITEFNLTDKENNLFMHYLTEDAEGNFIIYGSIIRFNIDDIYFVALVSIKNDDLNEINFFVPTSLYDYQYECMNFKELNGWQNNNSS